MSTEFLIQSAIKTALHSRHVHLGAKMVPFAGYEMPVSYPAGIKSEYFAVRNEAGLFDVSHMGEFMVKGSGAGNFIQRMTINDVARMDAGDAQYSAMCKHNGGIVDDLLVYKKEDGFFLVVNAANINKDFDWLTENAPENITLQNLSQKFSLIALQGPRSRDILSGFTNIKLNLDFYTFTEGEVCGESVLLSRTGYTGELGFEIYGSDNAVCLIWDALVEAGVQPAGLAARDILRMEMKYCLYGNDIDDNTNPLEAGLGWVTSLNKGDFIAGDLLRKIKAKGPSRKLIAFTMEERGIPRQGYELFAEGEKVGEVTSGTQSPSLKAGIGLGYVEVPFHKPGQELLVQIRNKQLKATVIKPPFIKGTSLHS